MDIKNSRSLIHIGREYCILNYVCMFLFICVIKIKEEIRFAKKTYALRIYSEGYINNEDENLELMIDCNLFLDTLLCQIRR